MPATTLALDAPLARQAAHWGAEIRAARKRQRVSATSAAQAAGISRATWHRIEAGEPSVTLGAFLHALATVGLNLDLQKPEPTRATQREIRLREYPGLRALAWQLDDSTVLTPAQLRELLERQGRHLDEAALSPNERALLARVREQDV